MSKFHTLSISDITRETADCVSIAFDVPSSLQKEYQYIQGQYVTLKLNIGGEELRRSYSICSSPTAENELRIAAKKIESGKVSGFLNEQLKKGDKMEVMTPMGGFYTPLNSSNKKNYVLFAGGSGVTPMLSILKTVLKEEPQSTIILFYGNLNEVSTIFKSQFDELAQQNNSRFSLHYIFDKPNTPQAELYTGIMTVTKVKALIENHVGLNLDNEFFICGPTPMMQNVEKTLLEELEIPTTRVHLEYFTAVLTDSAPVLVSGERIISQVTIIMDGDETVIDLASDGPSILDAALDADVDVPFACKGAVCCTCRAKVLEGKVHMKNNYALSQEDVDDGFVLTCQSHPLTPNVKIDYDV